MSKENNKLNLYQRISKVMEAVQYLKKDDSVGSGSYAYKAISEEKVTETIRKALIQYGLVILPVEQEHLQKDHIREQNKIVSISTVNVRYKIINIDNPSEFEILASSGTGVDSQDKGVGKAMTYSYKYTLLRTFAIPTGDDPDKIHNNDLDKQQQKEAAKAAPEPAKMEAAKAALAEATQPKTGRPATTEQLELYKELLLHESMSDEQREKGMELLPTLDYDLAAQKIGSMQKFIKKLESKAA